VARQGRRACSELLCASVNYDDIPLVWRIARGLWAAPVFIPQGDDDRGPVLKQNLDLFAFMPFYAIDGMANNSSRRGQQYRVSVRRVAWLT
jgi:hypothetical protein